MNIVLEQRPQDFNNQKCLENIGRAGERELRNSKKLHICPRLL